MEYIAVTPSKGCLHAPPSPFFPALPDHALTGLPASRKRKTQGVGSKDQSKKSNTHLIGQRRSSSLLELSLVLGHQFGVDLDLGGSERGGSDKVEGLVADQLAGEPQEGLFKVVLC